MKFTLSILFCFLPQLIFAQFFSGEITYQTEYIPKHDGVNIDSIKSAAMYSSNTYLITAGYYKSTHFKDGKENYSYTYHDETKFMYDEFEGKNYITYRDSRKPSEDSLNFKIYKDSLISILGNEAFMVKSEDETTVTKTYYSTEKSIDYKTFAGHEVANWYERLQATNGSIMLKYIVEYEDFFEISEAVKIKEYIPKRSEFDLPTNKPIVASFTELDKIPELKPPTPSQIACYQNRVQEAAKIENETTIVYVEFLLSEKGEVSNISTLEKDGYGFYKTAISIIAKCGFSFSPGEIDGKAVSAVAYFPIRFD